MKNNRIFLTLTSGFAILAITATTAFAANNLKGTMALADIRTNQTVYSTDGGTTWGSDAPEGLKNQGGNANDHAYKLNADGSVSVVDPSQDTEKGTGIEARIQMDTNEVEYSTDGGKTWSKEKPQSLVDSSTTKEEEKENTYTMNADGSVSNTPANVKGTGIEARIHADTNEVEYSTDSGKTWTKEKPAGLK